MTDQKHMREFILERMEDKSGVSGVGSVARGVQLPSGKIVLEWTTNHAPISQAFYENTDELLAIHGHQGKTLLRWVDNIETHSCQKSYSSSLRKGLVIGFLLGVVAGGCLLLSLL